MLGGILGFFLSPDVSFYRILLTPFLISSMLVTEYTVKISKGLDKPLRCYRIFGGFLWILVAPGAIFFLGILLIPFSISYNLARE